MKRIYMSPDCTLLNLAQENVLGLFVSASVADMDDGPAIGFDDFK